MTPSGTAVEFATAAAAAVDASLLTPSPRQLLSPRLLQSPPHDIDIDHSSNTAKQPSQQLQQLLENHYAGQQLQQADRLLLSAEQHVDVNNGSTDSSNTSLAMTMHELPEPVTNVVLPVLSVSVSLPEAQAATETSTPATTTPATTAEISCQETVTEAATHGMLSEAPAGSISSQHNSMQHHQLPQQQQPEQQVLQQQQQLPASIEHTAATAAVEVPVIAAKKRGRPPKPKAENGTAAAPTAAAKQKINAISDSKISISKSISNSNSASDNGFEVSETDALLDEAMRKQALQQQQKQQQRQLKLQSTTKLQDKLAASTKLPALEAAVTPTPKKKTAAALTAAAAIAAATKATTLSSSKQLQKKPAIKKQLTPAKRKQQQQQQERPSLTIVIPELFEPSAIVIEVLIMLANPAALAAAPTAATVDAASASDDVVTVAISVSTAHDALRPLSPTMQQQQKQRKKQSTPKKNSNSNGSKATATAVRQAPSPIDYESFMDLDAIEYVDATSTAAAAADVLTAAAANEDSAAIAAVTTAALRRVRYNAALVVHEFAFAPDTSKVPTAGFFAVGMAHTAHTSTTTTLAEWQLQKQQRLSHYTALAAAALATAALASTAVTSASADTAAAAAATEAELVDAWNACGYRHITEPERQAVWMRALREQLEEDTAAAVVEATLAEITANVAAAVTDAVAAIEAVVTTATDATAVTAVGSNEFVTHAVTSTPSAAVNVAAVAVIESTAGGADTAVVPMAVDVDSPKQLSATASLPLLAPRAASAPAALTVITAAAPAATAAVIVGADASDEAELKLVRASRDRVGCSCAGNKNKSMCGAGRSSNATRQLNGGKQQRSATERMVITVTNKYVGWAQSHNSSSNSDGSSQDLEFDADGQPMLPLDSDSTCECYLAGVPCNGHACGCCAENCRNPAKRHTFDQKQVDSYRHKFVTKKLKLK